MAVIREKRNFTIGPIGVARVSGGVAGSNAAGTIAAAVSDSANQMADMFFRASAKEAEKVGLEQGQTVSREQIVAIDPVTGQPKAYEPPKGFGGIAQEAYQRVVMSRFQASIEEEIKLKARELAVRYDGSVDRYSTAMSEYIGAMAQNAQGQFKTYITDVGTSYLNATRSAMAIDQMQRERAAAAAAQKASISEGNDALRRIVATYGPESLVSNQPTAATVTGTSIDLAIQDAVQAELFSQIDVSAMDSEKRFALVAGLVEYASRNTTTSNEAELLKGAIGTADVNLIPEKFAYLRPVIANLGYDELYDLEKVSDDFFSNRSTALKVLEEQDKNQAKAMDILSAQTVGSDIGRRSQAILGNALLNPPMATVSVARESFSDGMNLAALAEAEGRTAEATALRDRTKAEFNAYLKGLAIRAYDGATIEEAQAIEYAVDSGNIAAAPPKYQEAVSAIIGMEAISPGAIATFGTMIGDYRETGGKLETEKQQLQAFSEASTAVQSAGLAMSSLPTPNDIDKVYQDGVTALAGRNLEDTVREGFKRDLALSAATANLSRVFRDTNPTEAQLGEIATYLTDGIDSGVLGQEQKLLLDRVREYTAISENKSAVTTEVNKYISYTQGRINEERKKQEELRLQLDVVSGQADGSDRSVRETADKMLIERRPELGGRAVGDILLDERLLTDPKYTQVLNDVANMPVLPQSVANVFYGAMNNRITGPARNSVFRAWNNLRYSTNPSTGAEVSSPAIMAAMNAKDIAKMDLLSGMALVSVESSERIDEVSRLFELYQTDEPFKAKLEERLGGSLDVFINSLSGMDGAMPEDREAMKAAALGLFAASETTGMSADGIRAQLESQIERSFPIDGYVMNAYGGLRSRAAPSIILGENAPRFQDHILNRLSQDAYLEDGTKISAAIFADLESLESPRMAPSIGGFGGAFANQRTALPQVFLQPMGTATQGGATYRVMHWRPYSEGGPVSVRQEVDLGNGQKTYVPYYVRTDDSSFTRQIRNERILRSTQRNLEAMKRQQMATEFEAGNLQSVPTFDVTNFFRNIMTPEP